MVLSYKLKPTTNARRNTIRIKPLDIKKAKPYRKLLVRKIGTGGRNNLGRITAWHRHTPHRRMLRTMDNQYKESQYTVIQIEYDPHRSAYIALTDTPNGKRYILADNNMHIGYSIDNTDGAFFKPLNLYKLGSVIYNIEAKPGKGGGYVKSAGTYAVIKYVQGNYLACTMPSGETKLIHGACRACPGIVSNENHYLNTIGKAGRAFHMGRRPITRGMAMNPIDHPHGGGEGKSKGGHGSRTPWGMPTRGFRTRNNRRTQFTIVQRRR